jgi:cytochrome c556
MPGSNDLFGPLRRSRLMIGCALLFAGIAAGAPSALGQDQSAATTTDEIVARKTVMDTLSDRMDVIEAMIESGKINLEEAHTDADSISTFLMAFPHLFPPSTNQWKPNVDKDPVKDTFASPEIWAKFADFYRQATAASKAAYDASRAKDDTELKASIAQLRTGCNDCHAAYMKMD